MPPRMNGDRRRREAVCRGGLQSGRAMDDMKEGIVSDFLLSRKMIDKDTWERHRRMAILKMYCGTNPKYANDVDACAKACKVSVGFAKRSVQDDKA